MLIFAVIIYSFAITAANISVATFGPWISPINSFVLIGLDLALRDWLHFKIKTWQMLILILISGVITYFLNPSAEKIAIASSCAFTAAALTDWFIFSIAKGSWVKRANISNIGGAAVDSILFPTMAFGIFMPGIVAMQFASKIFGGFLWSLLIKKISGNPTDA